MALKIGVVGAGPSGLYFALLMKKRDPACDVVVYEQNPRDGTYGFGVVVAGGALQRIGERDPETFAALRRGAEVLINQQIILDGRSITIDNPQPSASIERLKLLQILQRRCIVEGVRIEFNRRIIGAGDLARFDLIVGADGGNSLVRGWHAEAFGIKTRSLTNRFGWYGAPVAFDTPTLCFKSTSDGGVFVGHYYRFTPTMSTFVAECDAKTWEAGFGDLTDAARKAKIEELFAEELRGEKLIENRSIWRCFQGVRTERWSVGNVVLIGDALRSMHFSVGSGTRQAMEDAVALFDAFEGQGDDVVSALALFEQTRKPQAGKLERASRASYEWYENVRAHMRGEVLGFAYGYMTRTGRVSDERLRVGCPAFMSLYDAARAQRA